MKIFQILQNNQNNIIFIDESFSFKALFFQVFWLIYYRLWKFVPVFLVMNIFLIILQNFSLFNSQAIWLLQLLVSIVIASFAKSWYKEHLLKQGYSLNSLVAANNLEEAKLKYYSLMEEGNDDIRPEQYFCANN